MLLLLDNYDSFTYNLVHYFQVLGNAVKIMRNNKASIDEILDLNPEYFVISPGPGTPKSAGITLSAIHELQGIIPIFGVCLGMQAIAEYYGGRIIRSVKPIHGKTSRIYHDNQGVFHNLPQGFSGTRYHSLIVERSSLPSCLEISAETQDGIIMGLRHKFLAIEGVQFHPESILTTCGLSLLKNYLNTSCYPTLEQGVHYA